jgi:hypothetical protein
VYVPEAAPDGRSDGLQPLGTAGQFAQLALVPLKDGKPDAAGGSPTSVAIFEQGLVQVLQASATGLQPKQGYVLALAQQPDGSGPLEPLSNFMAGPTGSAIVNAIGPVRQLVQGPPNQSRRYLVIAPRTADGLGAPVQVQGA